MKKKILLLNPSKWVRGITAIWIASHSSLLKRSGFDIAHFPIRKNSISNKKNTTEINILLNPFSNHYQTGNEDRVQQMEKNLK